MKALICPSLGPAENLRVTEVDAPSAGDGEALVEVAYAGLNFFDTLIIEGKYQVKAKPPFSPGGEFSGHVVALGPGARGFEVGDRVMGVCSYGAAAEAIAIPTTRLAKIPDDLALDKAAGLSVAYGTSLHALKQRAEMKPGESPSRAWRFGRRRARGGGDRQGDGRSRDRRRVVGRKARVRPPLWRFRDDQHGK